MAALEEALQWYLCACSVIYNIQSPNNVCSYSVNVSDIHALFHTAAITTCSYFVPGLFQTLPDLGFPLGTPLLCFMIPKIDTCGVRFNQNAGLFQLLRSKTARREMRPTRVRFSDRVQTFGDRRSHNNQAVRTNLTPGNS